MAIYVPDIQVSEQDWRNDRTLNGKWVAFATVIRPPEAEYAWIDSRDPMQDINFSLELSSNEANRAMTEPNAPVVWVQPAHYSFFTKPGVRSEVNLDLRVREGAQVVDDRLSFIVTLQFTANEPSYIFALLLGGMIPLR